MRRFPPILVAVAALASATAATAAFQPIRRDLGEASAPRVRPGTIVVPAGHAAGLVTVIVGLPLPPLAQARGRTLAAGDAARKLDVGSRSSRAYLERLERAQEAAAAELLRAIPQARIGYRYRVVLDGFEVTLPARRLPTLARLRLATAIYPSVRYAATTNRSPELIGATALQRLTGADGAGMKIAIVDTGVDPASPFLGPRGFSYPPGFPKGSRRWTTAKVIVARTFPGPGSGRKGRLAFDPSEPHGTHVAGIAAGDAGTDAPAGGDHPAVTGLSGVAPRAWIGNYRVFTVPTSVGHVADTPQIVAAFEAAVSDGMDVVNFSGGGPETDPANDALIEAVRNVAAAGVVPVVAAGNDRDDYGLGTVGSPGTAPDAISVAAVSNTHDFTPAGTVTAPGAPAFLARFPVEPGVGGSLPSAWAGTDQPLVDVGGLVGTDGRADPYLCGSAADPNARGSTLPAGSLRGAIALVLRGRCTFDSKGGRARAAGAEGILLVDNRPGEPNEIPVALAVPSAMVSDLDGARLRSYMATSGGRTTIRVSGAVQEIVTGRGGTITSFSSGGPTDFGHALKPDLAAPGGQILSSTPPLTTGSTFAVFNGTSMAAPHVAGAAALLLELHRGWTPQQVKSALVSTAAPAWGDTAGTTQASVLLAGGGLVDLPAANDPRLFTDPASLSFGDLDAAHGAQRKPTLLTVADAGGGAGSWQVDVEPQATSAGATLDVAAPVDVAPGAAVSVPVTARAAADAAAGADYGFLVLRQGSIARRVPYAFFVTRPRLPEAERPQPLVKRQRGDTRRGASHVSLYCCPSAPFGNAPDYPAGPPMDESGAERVYVTHVDQPVANAGVSVLSESPGALVDPWWLGSLDENDVQGYAGTPVDVNDLMPDVKTDVGAAGVVFPRQQEFFVAVDSHSDPFTGRSMAGSYVLNWWVNDVTPPRARLLTTRVSAGRPLLVARATDRQSGVDPFSLTLSYSGALVGATDYDPDTGLALFPLAGTRAPGLAPGRTRATVVASDFQETKNVATYGPSTMPNTTYRRVAVTVVDGPTVTWLAPEQGRCVRGPQAKLLVAAASTSRVRAVRFLDGGRLVGVAHPRRASQLVSVEWRPAGAAAHRLRAVVVDGRGRTAAAALDVRTGCA